MIKKRILFLTGKRGGYSCILPIILSMQESEWANPHLVACDMHSLRETGHRGIEQFEEDGVHSCELTIARQVPNQDSDMYRTMFLGSILYEAAIILDSNKPDLVVLYGDRGEVAAFALAATQMGIPIAHLQGGDITCNVDDTFRHIITKMANIHFCSNEGSSALIADMGEDQSTIFTVGDHHIDSLSNFSKVSDTELYAACNISNWGEKIITLLYHPYTYTWEESGTEMRDIITALDKYMIDDYHIVAIHPCTDPGYKDIVFELEVHADRENFHYIPNLSKPMFSRLLQMSSCIVGNSSCGIIEAPYLRTPTVNVGDRQLGRLLGPSIYGTKCHMGNIMASIELALRHDKDGTYERHYGDGKASAKTYIILKDNLTEPLSPLAEPKYIRWVYNANTS
jgi:GDP/UDP-N,N'-diacetylbacillosamine 2-epimerase (hydrolysing)